MIGDLIADFEAFLPGAFVPGSVFIVYVGKRVGEFEVVRTKIRLFELGNIDFQNRPIIGCDVHEAITVRNEDIIGEEDSFETRFRFLWQQPLGHNSCQLRFTGPVIEHRNLLRLYQSNVFAHWIFRVNRGMREFISIVEKIDLINESTTKDGREIHVWHEETTQHADLDYDPNWDVYAAIDGKVVGSGWFTDDHFNGVDVNENYRRLGVASAIYDYVESLGFHVRPSPNGQEPDGEAFWAARKD